MAHAIAHFSALPQCFLSAGSYDVKLFKLLWQVFLWGRTIKHCAIKLRQDVYGIGLEMAIKTDVKVDISQSI